MINLFRRLVEHFAVCQVLDVSFNFYHSPEECAMETICLSTSKQFKLTFQIEINIEQVQGNSMVYILISVIVNFVF